LNILIVKLSAIGDVVQSLPFLEALRNGFPKANIDWVVEEDSSEVVVGHPALNRVILSRRKSWQGRLTKTANLSSVVREMVGFLTELRSVEYDLVIDLQGLLKSGVLVGLSKGKRKIGMGGSREGATLFLNERRIPVDYGRHAIDRYLSVAETIGCDADRAGGRIPYSDADKLSVERILDRYEIQDETLVAINPMARWPTKLWDTERFAVLATRIREELGCQIVFTGSSGDDPVIRRIMGTMPVAPVNLAGKTSLRELAYFYTRCRLLVTTDTGPMHVAAAMGCPVVALFGPTAPWRTGPYGPGHAIIRTGVACSPCFSKRCDHMTCMKEIGIDQVFDAVKTALRSK